MNELTFAFLLQPPNPESALYKSIEAGHTIPVVFRPPGGDGVRDIAKLFVEEGPVEGRLTGVVSLREMVG